MEKKSYDWFEQRRKTKRFRTGSRSNHKKLLILLLGYIKQPKVLQRIMLKSSKSTLKTSTKQKRKWIC